MAKNYMVRVGVTSNLDDDELESAIGDALDTAGIDNTVYEVLEAEENESWTMISKRAVPDKPNPSPSLPPPQQEKPWGQKRPQPRKRR